MADHKVDILFNGKDKVSPVVNKINTNLRELGEKVSSIGMRMTAAFTLPITGAALAIGKFGQEAVKTSADLKKALDEAMKSGDPEKIKEASAAWAALSPDVKRAADAYNKLQAALKPANDALTKAKTEILVALVPVFRELAPLITTVANKIAELATRFAALPVWQKEAILGLVGLVAALGPVIAIAGQVINVIGTLQMLLGAGGLAGAAGAGAGGLGTMALGALATIGPILALTAAVGALIYLINSGTAAKAWTTFKQMVALGLKPFVSNEQFIQGSRNLGLIEPAGGGGGGVPAPSGVVASGGSVNLVYAPALSAGNRTEMENVLLPYIRESLRKLGY